MNKPKIINFHKIGLPSSGYISVAEMKTLPFEVKRVCWTYFNPEDVERGRYAYQQLEQILVSVAGEIIVNAEMPDGFKEQFVLDSPNQEVYLPKYSWHIMQYNQNALKMCIASMVY